MLDPHICKDPTVIERLAKALAQTGSHQGTTDDFKMLAGISLEEGNKSSIRILATEAVIESKDPGVYEVLKELVWDYNLPVRRVALNGLKAMNLYDKAIHSP